MPNDVLRQSASIRDPKLTSGFGECLLSASMCNPAVMVPHEQFADIESLQMDCSVALVTRQCSYSGKSASDAQHTVAIKEQDRGSQFCYLF